MTQGSARLAGEVSGCVSCGFGGVVSPNSMAHMPGYRVSVCFGRGRPGVSLTGTGAYVQHSAGLIHRSEAELPVEEALGNVVLEIQPSLFLLAGGRSSSGQSRADRSEWVHQCSTLLTSSLGRKYSASDHMSAQPLAIYGTCQAVMVHHLLPSLYLWSVAGHSSVHIRTYLPI